MTLRFLFFSLCCAGLSHSACRAQSAERYRYQATITGFTAPAQLKLFDQRLHELAGVVKWEFNGSTSVLELTTNAMWTSEGLQASFSDLGCTVTAFEHITTSSPNPSRRRSPGYLDFPVFLDTGDRIADNQRYEAEKSLWIATHPEAYRDLTTPVTGAVTTQPE